MEDRDTKGDLYEYMLGKIASAGQNGQFRTPRHIIRLMVELTEPKPTDVICDPACGTAGFLVAAGEYLRHHHPEALRDDKLRAHFHSSMFHGFDFDNTMLRIGSMNMLLHGVENPAIVYRDSLAQDHAGENEKYTLVLANPPFAGSLDYESTAKDLLAGGRPSSFPMVFCPAPLRRIRICAACWWKIISSTPSLNCPLACSALMRASQPLFSFLRKRTAAARISYGFMT
jgi:type I restriction enzyme M protein